MVIKMGNNISFLSPFYTTAAMSSMLDTCDHEPLGKILNTILSQYIISVCMCGFVVEEWFECKALCV